MNSVDPVTELAIRLSAYTIKPMSERKKFVVKHGISTIRQAIKDRTIRELLYADYSVPVAHQC